MPARGLAAVRKRNRTRAGSAASSQSKSRRRVATVRRQQRPCPPADRAGRPRHGWPPLPPTGRHRGPAGRVRLQSEFLAQRLRHKGIAGHRLRHAAVIEPSHDQMRCVFPQQFQPAEQLHRPGRLLVEPAGLTEKSEGYLPPLVVVDVRDTSSPHGQSSLATRARLRHRRLAPDLPPAPGRSCAPRTAGPAPQPGRRETGPRAESPSIPPCVAARRPASPDPLPRTGFLHGRQGRHDDGLHPAWAAGAPPSADRAPRGTRRARIRDRVRSAARQARRDSGPAPIPHQMSGRAQSRRVL